MLACAGVDRQHEHEPSGAPGPVGRRGGYDRELHADADGRVYACQPAVSRVMTGAAVGFVACMLVSKDCPCNEYQATRTQIGLRRLFTPVPSNKFGPSEEETRECRLKFLPTMRRDIETSMSAWRYNVRTSCIWLTSNAGVPPRVAQKCGSASPVGRGQFRSYS